MFQSWRLKLRQADKACRVGKLEEACRMLTSSSLQEYLPAQKLLVRVADELVRRGSRRLENGQVSSGWRDIELGKSLGATQKIVTDALGKIIEKRLAEAECSLGRGDAQGAVLALEELLKHGTKTHEVQSLLQLAQVVREAQEFAKRGEFAQAEGELVVAMQRSSNKKSLEQLLAEYRLKKEKAHSLEGSLHRAITNQEWNEALEHAGSLLEICPTHEAALHARCRAWKEAGLSLAAPVPLLKGPMVLARSPVQVIPSAPRSAPYEPRRSGSPLQTNMQLERYMLWIDEVGGFLVCLANTVTLGQPSPGLGVDIPILADVSSRHATIVREGEGYLLTPHRETRLDGQLLERSTTLRDGQLLELARGVLLRFCIPHAWSRTARLDFASRHRTLPMADGILLMADSCVLGRSAGAHVSCKGFSHDVVIFRRDDSLYCRSSVEFKVDGAAGVKESLLTPGIRVEGDSFGLSLEKI